MSARKINVKDKAKLLKTAYDSVFRGPMGKIVMKDLQEWCHIKKTSYVPSKGDATAFNEGKRFVYLRIVQMSKIDIDRIMAEPDRQPEV